MRIALIGPAHPYKGGAARHTTELAHRLASAGHDVVIESWRAMYPAVLYPGVQTVQVAEGRPFPRTRRLLSWRRPDSWLRAGRRLRGMCDLAVFVYVVPVQVPAYLSIMWGLRHGSALVWHPWRRRAATRTPLVVTICHNVLPHERRPGDIALTRALLRRSDAVLTHTERLACAARSLAAGTPVMVARMPPHLPAPAASDIAPAVPGAVPAVPPHPGEPACGPAPWGAAPAGPATTPAVRRRESAPHEPAPREPASRGPGAASGKPGASRPAARRLVFFGIVRPYKGLDVLLRAMARAPDSLLLTVAGEFWGGAGATRALVSELGLDARVELRPGYLPADEIGALLAGADALVLPYRSATSSQNAWLAFAYGVPVIATRTGSFAEQVTDGVDGLLCEPGDVADLARALTRLCEPGVSERLRARVSRADGGSLWDCYLSQLLEFAVPHPVTGTVAGRSRG